MTNGKGKGSARWCISFELEEESITKETQRQREITHAIARGISAIAATSKLKIVDYKILKNGKEQPEADTLHMKWAKESRRLDPIQRTTTKKQAKAMIIAKGKEFERNQRTLGGDTNNG